MSAQGSLLLVPARAELPALLSSARSAAAALAAKDSETFRAEGPRVDARIGTLLSLLLGALGSSTVVGGVGGALSREHHAVVAFWTLGAAAIVLTAGLLLVLRLILPRLAREQGTPRARSLRLVAALPSAEAAREYYRTVAVDALTFQSMAAWSQARLIARRLRRFRRAGYVLALGVALAAFGFLALAWGW